MTDIERLRRRVADTADPASASKLGWLLWRRDAASDEAIQVFALAMAMDVGEIPTQLLSRVADRAADYAAGLLERALTTTEPAVAELAVRLWNRIANILSERADYLSRLGIALRVRFERTGSRDSLNLAVRAGETALIRADPDDPQFAAYLYNIAITLRVLYVHTGDRAELTRAVELLHEAVDILPTYDPERATYLSALATTLRLRQANAAEVSTAVRLARRAVEIGAPGNVALLSNLAVTLLTSFWTTGSIDDLDEAVAASGAAVAAMPGGHPTASVAWSNLAAALRVRFETTGTTDDLHEAIRAAGTALRTAAPGDPDRAMYQVNLAVGLLTRFERKGRVRDLDQAVTLLSAAEASTPPTHTDRAVRLSHLGLALEAQARRTGSLTLLDAAVARLRASGEVAE